MSQALLNPVVLKNKSELINKRTERAELTTAQPKSLPASIRCALERACSLSPTNKQCYQGKLNGEDRTEGGGGRGEGKGEERGREEAERGERERDELPCNLSP